MYWVTNYSKEQSETQKDGEKKKRFAQVTQITCDKPGGETQPPVLVPQWLSPTVFWSPQKLGEDSDPRKKLNQYSIEV